MNEFDKFYTERAVSSFRFVLNAEKNVHISQGFFVKKKLKKCVRNS
jgi:hypothetical protein